MWNENKTSQFDWLSSCHQGPTWNAFPSYLSQVSPWVKSTSHMLLNNMLHGTFLSLDEFYGFTLSYNKISNHKPFFFLSTHMALSVSCFIFLCLCLMVHYADINYDHAFCWTTVQQRLSSKIIIVITSNYSLLGQFRT